MNKTKILLKNTISNGMKKLLKIVPYLAIALLVGVTAVSAGSLTPPGGVANTMYTLTDIFNLSTGTTTTEGAGAIDPTPGTIVGAGKTLTEVYEAIAGEIDNLSAGVIATGTSAFGIDGALSAGGLPKTNQTLCYAADGGEIACTDGGTALGGQDGYYQKGTALSYTDNLDGTISDGATGLMWKKCSEGKTYDVGTSTCTGADATRTWTVALSACEADTTGGHTDWRLPNIRELLAIVDYGTVNPAINSLLVSQSGVYWSSTTYQDPGYQFVAWVVDFNDGYTFNGGKTSPNYVRCVR